MSYARELAISLEKLEKDNAPLCRYVKYKIQELLLQAEMGILQIELNTSK